MWRNVRTVAAILCFGVALGLIVRLPAKREVNSADPEGVEAAERVEAASSGGAASAIPAAATAAGHFSPGIAASIDMADGVSGPFAGIFNAHVVWELDGEGRLHPQWIPDFAIRVPTKLNARQAQAALAMLEDEDRIVAGHFILGSLMPEVEVMTELWSRDERIHRYRCQYLGLMLDVEVHFHWMPPRRRMILRNFRQQRDTLRAAWTAELASRGLLDEQ